MPPSIDSSSRKIPSNQNYGAESMEDTQESLKVVRSIPSSGTKSASGRRSRVSFSDPNAEEKKSSEQVIPQGNRKVPKRKNEKNRRSLSKSGKENNNSSSRAVPKEEGSPSRGFLSGLGRRLSNPFSDKKKGFVKMAEDIEDDEEQSGEDDPVMTIFESRNTQRVRFSLEGVDDTPQEKAEEPAQDKPNNSMNIRQFMSRALFGTSKSSKKMDEELEREVAELGGSLVWQSAQTPMGPEVIHTTSDKKRTGTEIMLSFTEDSKARATVVKLLNRARRAENIHFRYEYAVKCYLKALGVLKKANYPDDHPTVLKSVRLLNHSHHVLSSYKNSADIVKMGIKYEDSGEFVRALKMYTIAYRIRRDNLSRNHPSLVVLLNMLGSIQIKRGELREAMQIYELALKDSPVIFSASDDNEEIQPPTGNLLAKSVTYREMGTIYERWGNVNQALNIYHKSLECVSEWKEAVRGDVTSQKGNTTDADNSSLVYSISDVQVSYSAGDNNQTEGERGEMEIFLGPKKKIANNGNFYESFFPPELDEKLEKGNPASDGSNRSTRDSHADMDLALTLHQIAQLYRCEGEFSKALEAYTVALRGMKYALGKHHPNVAAVLGNIGNLQKEMGDLDAAYNTYQEVLGIESYRLGLSHPDVAITLHNVATIDAARGNHEHSLHLYRKVLGLQKKLFGYDHVSVSVTAACMGDVYERIGEYRNAMDSFEEALRIKSAALGRHSVEVARIVHKLGKLSFLRGDNHMADSYISRAVLIYRLNKVAEEHEWLVDANRDAADIDATIALTRGGHCEV